MPSKPRTLAGILRSRRHADREYNRARRDPAVARIHGSARWQAVRAQVLRDEPVCRECAAPRADRARHAGGPRRPPGRGTRRWRSCGPTSSPACTACHGRKSAAERPVRQGRGEPRALRPRGPERGAGRASIFTG